MEALGIDFGGSGIKGAIVNTDTGEMVSDRFRIPTPDQGRPEDVAEVVKQLVDHFAWTGPVGIGFPSVVIHGVIFTAANISSLWVGIDAEKMLMQKTGCKTWVINDADAAGIAEMAFGAGRGMDKHVVMLLTIGTGIGSAFFTRGVLLPNTEFGHIKIRGKDAEHRVSDAARQQKDLTWKEWAERFQEYLNIMEGLFWPDLIIIGGGGSKKFDKFAPFLNIRPSIVPAQLLNDAGIIGAAIYASQNS